MIGTVTWFDNKKGIGFTKDIVGGDHFIHFKDLKKTGIHKLYTGNKIEFDIITGDKGTYIANVKLLDKGKTNAGI